MISSHDKRFSVKKKEKKKRKKRDRYGFRVGTDRECMEEKLVVVMIGQLLLYVVMHTVVLKEKL